MHLREMGKTMVSVPALLKLPWKVLEKEAINYKEVIVLERI